MSELKEKILEKMKNYTLAALATIAEDGKPWARYVVVKADDQLNIWFATFKNSRKTSQVAKNPEVHLTLGVSDPQTAVSWLQIQGRAELFEDAETRNAVWYDLLNSILDFSIVSRDVNGVETKNLKVNRSKLTMLVYTAINSFARDQLVKYFYPTQKNSCIGHHRGCFLC